MKSGQIPVIAGFQGIGPDNSVTTLGRGGSDTSAVALAAALQADRCDIYTDVDGVYTTDPRIVPNARKLAKITYEEMLELASLGAKVLQTRSVELAMKYRVPVQVLSSFNDVPGTLVVDEEEVVEQEIVTGIAYSRDEAKITVRQCRPSRHRGRRFRASGRGAYQCRYDRAERRSRRHDRHDLYRRQDRFLAPRGAGDGAPGDRLSEISSDHKSPRSRWSASACAASRRGGTMFGTLAEQEINIQVISTSEIKVSALIAEEYTELAVRALHTAYKLDA